MCGIIGIFNYQAQEKVDKELLARMSDKLVHRGPDGGEVWTNKDQIVGFGHRRLSIIDLSETAAQPMANEDNSVWITFNGEIYNHSLLRDQLLAKHDFKTDHSDTEVLIHGYEEWGLEGLLNRIEGDYGFAIWDENERNLYLCRDRVGVKPVYFSFQNSGLIFSSEIKAILEHPEVEREIDYMAMYHYLSFLTTPAPLTMFKDIYKLPSGFYMKIDQKGNVETKRYWDAVPGKSKIKEETDGLSRDEKQKYFIDGILKRLNDGVEKRMMSDVPIGVFLSGGIDSSTNVALMSKCTNKPLETFTVGFKDHKHLNELEHAKLISEKFNTNHHEILIDEDDMMGYIDELVYQQDEPIADWVCIPLYFVSKLAKDKGVTVIQVGEGADEQFSGYRAYMNYLKMERKFWKPYRKWLPSPLKRMISWASEKLTYVKPGFHFYADIIKRATFNKELFWSGATVFWNVMKDQLLHTPKFKDYGFSSKIMNSGLMPSNYASVDSFNVISSFLQPFDSQFEGKDTLTRMTYNEFQLRLPELLLMRVDKITMSVSLESRVPFLDDKLIDFTMDIPQEFKVQNGEAKYLFKKAVEGIIPHSIIYRKKMGFNAPMAEWLRSGFGQKVKEGVLNSKLINGGHFKKKYIEKLFDQHMSGKIDNSLYIWTLFNLTEWYRHWILEEV